MKSKLDLSSCSFIRTLILSVLVTLSYSRAYSSGTYTVGAGQTYTTLKAAFDAVNAGTINGVLVFEVAANSAETAIASLNASGSGAANYTSILIYPTGGSRVISGALATSLITLNGADNVTIDGRLGGTGASSLTITNDHTGGAVVLLQNDATLNSVRYCTITGANQVATTSVFGGLVSLSTTTAVTGNDDNTISFNLFTKSAAGYPNCLIASNGTAAKTNSGISIQNNQFTDHRQAAIWVQANADTWTINANHFYQNVGSTQLTGVATAYSFINFNTGSAYTITNNYFGGQAVSCGGAAYSFTTARQVFMVNFAAAVTGNNTINGNTFGNFDITASFTGTALSVIYTIGGTANYTVGAVGAGNTFGSASGSANFVVNSTTAGSCTVNLVNYASTGTNITSYNSFGGLSLLTSTSSGFIRTLIFCSGTSTITNNTIGNGSPDNIVVQGAGNVTMIRGAGNFVRNISGNTVRNVMSTSTGTFTGISLSGNVTGSIVASNTIGDVTTNNMNLNGSTTINGISIGLSGTGDANITDNVVQQIISSTTTNIYGIMMNGTEYSTLTGNRISHITKTAAGGTLFGIAGYFADTFDNNIVEFMTSASSFTGILCSLQDPKTMTNNVISGISVTAGTFTGIYCAPSSVLPSTVSNNTVTDITISSGSVSPHVGIGLSSAGTFNCNNNMVQQFNLTNAGVASLLYGINLSANGAVNASGNTIHNFTSASPTSMLAGIYLTGNQNHSIVSNTIRDFTSAGAFSGIYINSTGTSSVTSNTVGSASAGNISVSGDAGSYGIMLTSGTFTCSGNTIQNIVSNSTGAANTLAGIISSGTSAISGNTVTNLTTATNCITTSGNLLGLNGIYLSTGGSTVTQNVVSNLTSTSSGAGTYSVCGIYSKPPTGTNTLRKNRVTQLSSAATDPAAFVAGIFLGDAGNAEAFNNVVLLDNNTASGNSIALNGIRNNATGATTIYHNTLKIYGTATSNSGSSAAYYNGDATNLNLRNNIFQNLRTNAGATGKHYALQYALFPTSATEDYNYAEASGTGGFTGYYASDRLSIADWQGAAGTGANDNTGSIILDASGEAINPTVFDIANSGTDLLVAVADDILSTARPATPFRGAYEGLNALGAGLIGFDAVLNNERTVNLIWSTSSEFNNDYFLVQRSTDMKGWSDVAKIDGAGSSNTVSDYASVDANPSAGTNYYRLKQVDFDGKYSYSDIRVVNIQHNGSLVVYPNPASGNFTIESKNVDRKEVSLFNAMGQEVHLVILAIGDDIIQYSTDMLENGFYNLRISSGNETLNSRLVISKE